MSTICSSTIKLLITIKFEVICPNILLLRFKLVNEDTQGHYAVWDLAADNRVWNSEMIKNIHWRKLNFPNSLYAQYMFYPNIMGGEDGRRDSLLKIVFIQVNPCRSLARRPMISSMFNYSAFIVAGSTLGDIHFFKERALHFDQDFILGIHSHFK